MYTHVLSPLYYKTFAFHIMSRLLIEQLNEENEVVQSTSYNSSDTNRKRPRDHTYYIPLFNPPYIPSAPSYVPSSPLPIPPQEPPNEPPSGDSTEHDIPEDSLFHVSSLPGGARGGGRQQGIASEGEDMDTYKNLNPYRHIGYAIPGKKDPRDLRKKMYESDDENEEEDDLDTFNHLDDTGEESRNLSKSLEMRKLKLFIVNTTTTWNVYVKLD